MSLDDDLARGDIYHAQAPSGHHQPHPHPHHPPQSSAPLPWSAPPSSSPSCAYCQRGSLQTLQGHLDSLIQKYTDQKGKLKEAKKLLREYATTQPNGPAGAASPNSPSSAAGHQHHRGKPGSDSQAAIQNLQDELARVQADLDASSADGQTKMMSLRARELEVNTLKQTIASKNGRIELLQKDIEKLKATASTLSSGGGWTSILGGGGAAQETKAALHARDKQIHALEAALSQGLEAQRQAAERLEEAHSETRLKEESIQQLHATLQHTRTNLEETEGKLDRLSSEFHSLQASSDAASAALRQQLLDLQSSLTHNHATFGGRQSSSLEAFEQERERYRGVLRRLACVWKERIGWDDQRGRYTRTTTAIEAIPADDTSMTSRRPPPSALLVDLPDLPLRTLFHRTALLAHIAFSSTVLQHLASLADVLSKKLLPGWMKLDALTGATTARGQASLRERLEELSTICVGNAAGGAHASSGSVGGLMQDLRDKWRAVEAGLKEIAAGGSDPDRLTSHPSRASSSSSHLLRDPLLLLTPLASLLANFAHFSHVHAASVAGDLSSNAAHQLYASWIQTERVCAGAHAQVDQLIRSLSTEAGRAWLSRAAPVMSFLLPAAWPMEWMMSGSGETEGSAAPSAGPAATSPSSSEFPSPAHLTSFLASLRSTLTSVQSHFASASTTLPSVSSTHSGLLLALLQPPIIVEQLGKAVGKQRALGEAREKRERQANEWKEGLWSGRNGRGAEEEGDAAQKQLVASSSSSDLDAIALANTATDLLDADSPFLAYLTAAALSHTQRTGVDAGADGEEVASASAQPALLDLHSRCTSFIARLNRSTFSYPTRGQPSGPADANDAGAAASSSSAGASSPSSSSPGSHVVSPSGTFAPAGLAYSLALKQRCDLAALHGDFAVSSSRYAELAAEHAMLEKQHSSLLQEHSGLLDQFDVQTDRLLEKENLLAAGRKTIDETLKLAEERRAEVGQQRMLVEELRATIDALQQQMESQQQQQHDEAETSFAYGGGGGATLRDLLPPSADSPQHHPRGRRSAEEEDDLDYRPTSSKEPADGPTPPVPAGGVALTLEEAISAAEYSTAIQAARALDADGVDEPTLLVPSFLSSLPPSSSAPPVPVDAHAVARQWLEQAKLFASLSRTDTDTAEETNEPTNRKKGNGKRSCFYEIETGVRPEPSPTAGSLPARSSSPPAAAAAAPSMDVSFALRQAIAMTPPAKSSSAFSSSHGGLSFSPAYIPHVSPEAICEEDFPPTDNTSMTSAPLEANEGTTILVGLEQMAEGAAADTLESELLADTDTTKQQRQQRQPHQQVDGWLAHQTSARLSASAAHLHSAAARLSLLSRLHSESLVSLSRWQLVCAHRTQQAKESRRTAQATLTKLAEVQLERSAAEQASKDLIDELAERIHELTTQLADKDAKGWMR